MEALVIAGALARVAKGIQAKKAADLEAQQFEEEAENARVAGVQDETQRRRELQRVLGTQQAIRAGRGLDLFSGSSKALRKDTIDNAERDIRTSQINYLSQQRKFGLGAAQSRANGRGALISGFGSAASSLSSLSSTK